MSTTDPEPMPFQGDPGLPERMARTLRHEVGDFLQKVYATVAILQKRLPADWQAERDVLTRLRARAETCKHLMDAIQDFLCRLDLAYDEVDLAGTAAALVAAAAEAHPQLTVRAEGDQDVLLTGDPARLRQVGQILLTNACEAARERVTFTTAGTPDDGHVAWTVTDDGAGMPPELAGRLFQPFFTTRAGHAGLGLALARKLVDLHGGRVEVGNMPNGGFRAHVVFPRQKT